MTTRDKALNFGSRETTQFDREALFDLMGLVPISWLDPMLTGPDAVIGKPPYGCPDIEAVLRAVKARLIAEIERLRAAAPPESQWRRYEAQYVPRPAVAAPPVGWQPIATAPKDGTRVIVATVGEVWCASQDDYGWYADDSERDFDPPTHWMALPAPPPPTDQTKI